MLERFRGSTRLIGLFAEPSKHSMSPQLHNEAFKQLGLDYAYLAFEIGQQKLPQAIQSIKTLNMRGANLSTPNKQAACQYLDTLSPAAELAGAVNTIVHENGILYGHMTDGVGFIRSLKEYGIDPIGKKMVIIGTGGAATAIYIQAALDGVKEITVFNPKEEYYQAAQTKIDLVRSKTNCNLSVVSLADQTALRKEIANSDILVHATRTGMVPFEDESLIQDAAFFHPSLFVVDIIYDPYETALLKLAREAGCQTLNGLGMLLWQGAAAFELWTGCKMPALSMNEHMIKKNKTIQEDIS